MPVNWTLHKAQNWKRRVCSRVKTALDDVTRVYTHEDLYPPIEEVDENGEFISYKSVMPHQKLFHAATSHNGRHAKLALHSGGVGSGKSLALWVDLVYNLRKYPGIKIVICLDGDCVVGDAPIGDLVKPSKVYTLEGESGASTPYRRGQADLWRVQTSSGRELAVTEHHRFLTPQGWRPLSRLSVGHVVACDGREHGNSRWGTPTGCRDRCERDFRHGDERLSPAAVACLHVVRQLLSLCNRLDMNRLLSSWSSESLYGRSPLGFDGESLDGSTGDEYIPMLLRSQGQSSGSFPLPDSGLLSVLREAVSGLSSLPPCLFDSALGAVATLGLDSFREYGLPPADSCSADSLQEPFRDRTCGIASFGRALSELRSFEELDRLATGLCQSRQRFCFDYSTAHTLQVLLHQVSSWYASYHNDATYWESLSSVEYKKFGDFFDLTVFSGSNYSCDGVFSHNCAAYDYYWDEFICPTFEQVLSLEDDFIIKGNLHSKHWWCANGSQFRFKAYDDPGKIKGWEAHAIYFEEASELGDGNSWKALQIYKACLMRLRAKPKDIPRFIRMAQNPGGHNWTWRIFVKDNPLGDDGFITRVEPCKLWDREREAANDHAVKQAHAQRREYNPDAYQAYRATIKACCRTCQLPCKQYPNGLEYAQYEKIESNGDVYYTIASGTSANTTLPEGFLSTLESNLADDPDLLRRMVGGHFSPIQSLIYWGTYFFEDVHIVSLDEVLEAYEWDKSDDPGIPDWIPAYLGIDVGGPKSPWALELYRIMEDDVAICTDEWYKSGATWDDVGAAIFEMTEGLTNVKYKIDPYSGPQKQGPSQVSVTDYFNKMGIPVEPAAGANVHAGILAIRTALKPDRTQPRQFGSDDWLDEIGGYEKGQAKLYYIDGACPKNILEKKVWRLHTPKIREAKEHEEGLSPPAQEKPVDRDDHAQRAEHFALSEWLPMKKRGKKFGAMDSREGKVIPGAQYRMPNRGR